MAQWVKVSCRQAWQPEVSPHNPCTQWKRLLRVSSDLHMHAAWYMYYPPYMHIPTPTHKVHVRKIKSIWSTMLPSHSTESIRREAPSQEQLDSKHFSAKFVTLLRERTFIFDFLFSFAQNMVHWWLHGLKLMFFVSLFNFTTKAWTIIWLTIFLPRK